MNIAVSDQIALKRNEVNARLAELRQARGRAVLEGRKINPAELAVAEAELAALDDAEEEAARQKASGRKESVRAAYDARLADYGAALDRRLTALDRAQDAASTMSDALNDVVTAAAEAHAAAVAMSNLLDAGDNSGPTELSPLNVRHRVFGYLRTSLRKAAGGANDFGGANVGPMPGDPAPGERWSDYEAKTGDERQYRQRHAPAAE